MIELPIRRYEGSVHVIAGQADLQRAMQDILQENVVGFDTETRPAFRPGESYLPLSYSSLRRVLLSVAGPQQDLSGAVRESFRRRKSSKRACR